MNENMQQKDTIIDISWPISASMTAYKDRRVVQIAATKIWEKDQEKNGK